MAKVQFVRRDGATAAAGEDQFSVRLPWWAATSIVAALALLSWAGTLALLRAVI